MQRPGLYVHIPFCSSICGYCNFNRGLFDAAAARRYVVALEKEIRRTAACMASGAHPADWPPGGSRADDLSTSLSRGFPTLAPDTLYFGGGTPSLLEPAEVARIIEACRDSFALAPDAEITLEANPETITRECAEAFREAGITRVSIGVQSFIDSELRRLGRIHTAARAGQALDAVRAAGIENVSIDLMMWLPGQSEGDWKFSLDCLVALRPAHASLYLLELYPNAPLKEEMARSGLSLEPDEVAAVMYEMAIDTLEAAGYDHYEISNFALPGRRSRHNMKYWTDGAWLGFGCGAHSTCAGVRWKDVSSVTDYMDRIESGAPVATEVRRLSARERVEESLFMRLRLIEGIDLEEARRHHDVDVWERYGTGLGEYVDAGLLLAEDGRLRLSRRGLLLSNEIMAVFIDGAVR